jgi:hypothetical protein
LTCFSGALVVGAVAVVVVVEGVAVVGREKEGFSLVLVGCLVKDEKLKDDGAAVLEVAAGLGGSLGVEEKENCPVADEVGRVSDGAGGCVLVVAIVDAVVIDG